jgi:Zn-dependent M28 family amino/carboxypeptidase
MRDLGFQNVRVEDFPLITWERGAESVEVVGPYAQRLVGAALGHSPATPEGGIEAEVAVFHTFEDLLAAPAGSLAGKIAYVDGGEMVRMQNGSGYGPQVRPRGAGPSEAAKRGAVAFVMRSVGTDNHRMPHTGTTRYVEGRVPVPAFTLAIPDADQLLRLAALGEPVRLRLSSTARTRESHSQNVVGELPGRTRPNEVIVLGSHMDSWDLGTGAIDDAAGGGITLGAALAIAEQGRTARTVRVVLYGSEEVSQPTAGSGGGPAYVTARGPAEVASHIIAGESDFGADRIYGLKLPAGAANSPFGPAAQRVLRPLGVLLKAEVETEGGVDVAPLAAAGVPVFGLQQDGTRYFDLHHTADDTFDKIDPEQLSQNVAAWAALVWLIADSEVDFRAIASATPR